MSYLTPEEQRKASKLSENTELRPSKRMRRKCLDCAGRFIEVRLCPVFDCELWPVRLGHTATRTQRREANWLDPEYVKLAGLKQALREQGGVLGATSQQWEDDIAKYEAERGEPIELPVSSPRIDESGT